MDLYDHQIDSIIVPKVNTFEAEDEIKLPTFVILFILYSEYFDFECCYAVNQTHESRLKQNDISFHLKFPFSKEMIDLNHYCNFSLIKKI